MKKYIDCDGVILDTEKGLLDKYYQLKEINPDLKKSKYLEQIDWYSWIRQARVLGDAINLLRSYDPNSADILTKVFTLNEARQKLLYFRELGVKNNVIFVPSDINKSEIVVPKGNVLVDDNLSNLDDWFSKGGISFYYGNEETKYAKVRTIEKILELK